MRRTISILTIAVLLSGLTAHAQTQQRGARQGDFTFGVTAGYNSSVMLSAKPGNQTSYSTSALSTNWNDKTLAVGVEVGWFFVDLWRVNIGGGFSFTNTPGYPGIPGTGYEMGDIPEYDAVVNRNTMQFNVSLGFDRYFRTGVEGLLPYVGIKAGYAYGQDIAFKDDETWMGQSAGEAFNIRGAVTVGVDYYFTEAFFIGASVDPFAYTYCYTMVKPQAGLGALAADSHNYSAFAAPTIRIGFCF